MDSNKDPPIPYSTCLACDCPLQSDPVFSKSGQAKKPDSVEN